MKMELRKIYNGELILRQDDEQVNKRVKQKINFNKFAQKFSLKDKPSSAAKPDICTQLKSLEQ